MELSNAEDDVESITGTGASDAGSESEDTTAGQTASTLGTSIVEEKMDPRDTSDATENLTTTARADPDITVASTKKKKRKRSKKGRH